MVESWKGDMNGMLIFSGLFSASLTAFIIESYEILQADPADTTVALLTQLVQQSTGMTPDAEASSPFEVTTAALVCNTLWFISLALSLTCSLLATLVEQWARDFLHKTDIHPAPIRRARVFSFLYRGIQQFRMHTVVDIIPMLLHVSLFLLFGGLVAFLLPVNKILTYLMASISAVFFVLYAAFTVLPIIYRACPYRTPLSAAIWKLRQLLSKYARAGVATVEELRSMTEAVLDEALEEPRERDIHAVQWTVACLTDVNELLRFAEAIPAAICGSKGFHDANDHLFLPLLDALDPQLSIGRRIVDLLRTSDDPSLDPKSRTRRRTACMKAIWALGMLPANTKNSPMFRFDKSTIDILNMATLDRYYSTSARAAVHFSRWNTFTACLQNIQEALDECLVGSEDSRKRTIQSIRRILGELSEEGLSGVDHFYDGWLDVYRFDFTSTFRELKESVYSENAHSVATSFAIIKDTVKPSIADRHAAGLAILYEFLDASLQYGSWPHEFHSTCQRLSRSIPSNVEMDSALKSLVHRVSERLPDPSLIRAMTTDIHDVDGILRLFLQHLPGTFGDSSDSPVLGRKFYRYVAKRESDHAVLHALSKCNLTLLQDSTRSWATAITDTLISSPNEALAEVTNTIWILCHFMHQDFYPFIEEDLPNWATSLYPLPASLHLSPSTKAVVLHFINIFLLKKIASVLDPEVGAEAVHSVLEEVDNHPILLSHFPERITSGPSSMLVVEVYFALNEQLGNLHVSILSEFLSAHSTEAKLYRGVETLKILRSDIVTFVVPWIGRITPSAQRAFACGVENDVRCLVDMPTDAELIETLNGVWQLEVWYCIDDVTSATILVDAIDMHLSLEVPTETSHWYYNFLGSPKAARRINRERCIEVVTKAATSQLPGYDVSVESLLA